MYKNILEHIVILLTLICVSTSAAVAPASELDTRGSPATPGIYGCENANWKPPCWWQAAPPKKCLAVDKIQSFGPDKGIVCRLFKYPNCKSGYTLGGFASPGVKDLSVYFMDYSGFNKPASIMCEFDFRKT